MYAAHKQRRTSHYREELMAERTVFVDVVYDEGLGLDSICGVSFHSLLSVH